MTRRASRREEIGRLLRLREREGLSLRALSERSGIPVGTLSWWTHQLRQEPDGPVFREVKVIEADDLSAATLDESAPELTLRHPSGLVVEIRGALAAEVAGRIVEAMAQWS
jgi:transcriptional regulator with XRE-family HTH domain